MNIPSNQKKGPLQRYQYVGTYMENKKRIDCTLNIYIGGGGTFI